jgi:hypothetical protein
MTTHFPGLLQALHIFDRLFPWLATGTSYTAHFPGLLQALPIHDRSFPLVVTGTSYT